MLTSYHFVSQEVIVSHCGKNSKQVWLSSIKQPAHHLTLVQPSIGMQCSDYEKMKY